MTLDLDPILVLVVPAALVAVVGLLLLAVGRSLLR